MVIHFTSLLAWEKAKTKDIQKSIRILDVLMQYRSAGVDKSGLLSIDDIEDRIDRFQDGSSTSTIIAMLERAGLIYRSKDAPTFSRMINPAKAVFLSDAGAEICSLPIERLIAFLDYLHREHNDLKKERAVDRKLMVDIAWEERAHRKLKLIVAQRIKRMKDD